MPSSAFVASGVYIRRVVPFVAGDGRSLNLVNIRSSEKMPDKGPVILVHGAGVRASIYQAPVETDIVDALIAGGYDVWLENWRASIDFEANLWTLDQAASPYADSGPNGIAIPRIRACALYCVLLAFVSIRHGYLTAPQSLPFTTLSPNTAA